MLALATTAVLTEPLPVPKPPGPDGSCPSSPGTASRATATRNAR